MSYDAALSAIENNDVQTITALVKNGDVEVTQDKCHLLVSALRSREYAVKLAVISGLNEGNIHEIAHVNTSLWEELIARNQLKLISLILQSGLDVKATFSNDFKAKLVAKMVQHGRVEMLSMWAEHDSDILYDYEMYYFKLKCIKCSYSDSNVDFAQKLPFNIARAFYEQWLYRAITVTELLAKVSVEEHKEGVLSLMSR